MGADIKRREARKRKFGAGTAQNPQITALQVEVDESVADEPPKKQSKQDLPTPASPQASATENEKTGSTPIGTDVVAENEDIASVKVQRFIVFIGNLPYTATDGSISQHFAKVQPKSIRHRTEKEGMKSKGYAFLEFEGYDRMKTCLKVFHGSDFYDGISPARKLNVELTVGGGGGKSKDRKRKLSDKNERLNEQRKRRNLEEEKQCKEAEEKKFKSEGQMGPRKGKKEGVNNTKGSKPENSVDNGEIHPSRPSRMAV